MGKADEPTMAVRLAVLRGRCNKYTPRLCMRRGLKQRQQGEKYCLCRSKDNGGGVEQQTYEEKISNVWIQSDGGR